MPRYDITPVPDADLQVGLLLAMLDMGTEGWLDEIGDVTDELVRFQPFPDSHSIGAIVLHLADCENWWLHHIAAGLPRDPAEVAEFLSDETDQYGLDWPTPPAEPFAWYLEKLRRVRKRTRELVLAINDPEHIGKHGDDEFTLRWILHHVIEHEAYHAGQAVFLSVMYGAQGRGN